MAKPTIVTRAGKGSALTFTEGDANFTNLQNATISVTDGTSSTAIDLNGTITFSAGSGISVDEASGTITISNTQSAGISNLVEDTTPQLGGNLDVNGNQIVSTSNGDIVIAPNGSGVITLAGLDWPTAPEGAGGFTGNVTSVDGSTERLNITNAINISLGDEITFAGGDVTDAGLSTSVTYFVVTANDIDGYIQVSETSGGSPKDLTTLSMPGDFTWSTGGSAGSFAGGEVLTYSNTAGGLVWEVPGGGGGGGGGGSLSTLSDVNITGVSNGQILVYDSASTKWINTSASSGGLENIVEDTTPQLGGSLDVNGNSITNSQGGGNITLSVGSGESPGALIVGTGSNIPFIASNGSNTLYVGTNSGTAPGAYAQFTPGENSGITLMSYGTGNVVLSHAGTGSTGKVIVGKLNTNATITSNGTGDLTLNTNSGTNSGSITIADGADQNISITPNGTGKISLDGLLWPNSDGSNGQVLTTNGSGTLSWATPASGGLQEAYFTTNELQSIQDSFGSFQNNNEVWAQTLNNSTGVSISGNSQFSFPSGTYMVYFTHSGVASGSTTGGSGNFRLQNTTSSSTVIQHNYSFAGSAASATPPRTPFKLFTLTETSTLRYQSVHSTNGLKITDCVIRIIKTS
jgi:hypothetical protein